MRKERRIFLSGAALLALACMPFAPAAAQQAQVPAGFISLFDGKTLNGWRGDPKQWAVEDGAITGGSDVRNPIDTFLISNRSFRNFEVRYKYRWVSKGGNSGFQFRSEQAEGNFALTGYQQNVTPSNVTPERFNMLYYELGDRQEIALLGQKAVLTRRSLDGGGAGRIVRTVVATTNERPDILATVREYPEWNEGVVIAWDNHIVGAINGMLAYDVIDNDPLRLREGSFGMQIHGGHTMKVQYKDIYVKPLSAPPKLEGRFKTKPGPATEPRQTYKDSVRAGLKDVALPAQPELAVHD
jgi:hypothetical protein